MTIRHTRVYNDCRFAFTELSVLKSFRSEGMAESQFTPLTFERLAGAISGNAVAIRSRTRLQPAAGAGTKVFPPTHAGGLYAMEKRRLPVGDGTTDTREADCVLLDSVQSQANRIEEALQDAVDRKLISIPLIVVQFGNTVADIQRVTSLQAPHRVADAILRDSLLGGKFFRQSEIGQSVTDSSLANATALFRYCPHALILGVWDSTGPKGGLGAKFARALVSEIIGIDAVIGKKTSSRIDPLQARAAVKVVKEKDGSWKIAKDDKAKGAVSPSEINHGNIPPDVADGSATIAYAEHSAVLSLAQLRRLRFPKNGHYDPYSEDAVRTVLAALALVGLTLSIERGADLRSRCLLFPDAPLHFELLEQPGSPESFTLSSKDAIHLLEAAVQKASKLGMQWETSPILLAPSDELIALVQKSQQFAALSAEGD
jgi:CRISPR-associated protein Csb1